MKNLVILGSTGSIGENALKIVRHSGKKFRVTGLSAYSNLILLKEQIEEFRPQFACVGSPEDAEKLKAALTVKCRVFSGNDGLERMAEIESADIVLIAVVGAAGLYPLMSALRSGKRIALANKESLVIAGGLVSKIKSKDKSKTQSGTIAHAIVPVDSEHSAIFQCLKNEDYENISKLIITGSGGPFYRKRSGFENITVEQALNHPRWQMGRKITIDSATLMNKGLEIIEAHHLFNVPFKNIQLLIHPQSIVHSLVEFVDSATIGLFSIPDMKLSIQYALTYPERFPVKMKYLQLEKIRNLEFYPPDFSRFPCLKLALEAGNEGHTVPAVLNASNEIAVHSFLRNQIKFTDIYKVIYRTLAKHKATKNPDLADIIEADAWARGVAQNLVRII